MRHLLRNALIATGVLGVGYLIFKPKDAPAAGSGAPPQTLDVHPGDLVQATVNLPGGMGAFSTKVRVTQVTPGLNYVTGVVDGAPGTDALPIQVPRANISQIIQRA